MYNKKINYFIITLLLLNLNIFEKLLGYRRHIIILLVNSKIYTGICMYFIFNVIEYLYIQHNQFWNIVLF